MNRALRVAATVTNFLATVLAISWTFAAGVENHSNPLVYLFVLMTTIFIGLLGSWTITSEKRFWNWYLTFAGIVALGLNVKLIAMHSADGTNPVPSIFLLILSFWGWPIPRPGSHYDRFTRSLVTPILIRLKQILFSPFEVREPSADELAARDAWDAHRRSGKQHGW